jgi:hypothetical protein
MKKVTLWISLFLVFALILAACSPETDEDGELIGTPVSETADVLETPVDEVSPTAAPAATLSASPAATEETPEAAAPEATPVVTEAPDAALPETGALNPALLSNLMEYQVCSPGTGDSGASWGEVEDVIIDFRSEYRLNQDGPRFDTWGSTAHSSSNGRLGYILLDADETLDLDGSVLIPWKAVSIQAAVGAEGSTGDGCLVVDVDQDIVRRAPIFDVNTTDLGTTNWDAQIRSFWEAEIGDLSDLSSGSALPAGTPSASAGTTDPAAPTPVAGTPGAPAATSTPVGPGTSAQAVVQLGVFRASDLLGMQVEGRGGEELGAVSDVVVDARSGATLYAVVDTGGRSIWVPTWLLLQRLDGSTLFLPADSEALETAPEYNQADLMNVVDQAWDAELFRWWNDVFRPSTSP